MKCSKTVIKNLDSNYIYEVFAHICFSFGISDGACGYGELGNTLNNGYVAGVHSPYKNGTGWMWCLPPGIHKTLAPKTFMIIIIIFLKLLYYVI